MDNPKFPRKISNILAHGALLHPTSPQYHKSSTHIQKKKKENTLLCEDKILNLLKYLALYAMLCCVIKNISFIL